MLSTAVSAARMYSSRPHNAAKNVVVVDGARIPFTLAGTVYSNYLAVDLGDWLMHRLIDRAIESSDTVCTAHLLDMYYLPSFLPYVL